jgi:5'-methylthioadenosine phosphorylase
VVTEGGRHAGPRSQAPTISETAQAIVRRVVPALDLQADCPCRHAVEFAINTPAELIPEATKARLDLLIGKYVR